MSIFPCLLASVETMIYIISLQAARPQQCLLLGHEAAMHSTPAQLSDTLSSQVELAKSREPYRPG